MRGTAKLGDHVLVYNFNVLCDAEKEIGPIGKAMTDVGQGSFATIRALVWAGLLTNKPDVTLTGAGDIIASVGFADAAAAVTSALEDAFPSAEGKAKPNRKV